MSGEIGMAKIGGWRDRWGCGSCGIVIGMGVNGFCFWFRRSRLIWMMEELCGGVGLIWMMEEESGRR